MYLSKLEIIGFKSFAQKTVLKFNGGISAIVGPNGCGKSNIVDAIRWVLGEQKTSVLRSDVMENVIFNGTKNRKPLSMAEVSLTLENTKGILPTEYTEVTITRRLFRNGESEYLINKNKCRLKDIIDLFMDTGLGADSYSVIELKMVEAILSGRPEERRALFEEAAGIKKYKLRRKEAAKKLETVMSDITRVQDILDEVRKNVASLARQAQKTRRYNTLMSEYKALDSSLLFHNYNLLQEKINSYQVDLTDLNKQKIKTEFEISEIQKTLAKLKEKYNITEEQYNLLIADETSLQDKIAKLEKDIAISNERLIYLSNSKENILNDIENSRKNVLKINTELQQIDNLITEKQNQLVIKNENLYNLKEIRESIITELKDIKQQSDFANEKVFSLQSSINHLKNQQNRNLDRKKMLERKIQGNFEESARLQKQLDELDNELAQSDNTLQQLQDELEQAENLLIQEKERESALKSHIESLKIKLNDKKNTLSARKNTLDYLKSIIDTNQTAQFLYSNKEWAKNSDINQLTELIATDEEYYIPVLSLLNYVGDFFLVCDTKEALDAIALLKNNNKGQTSFVVKDLINSYNIEKNNNFISVYDVIRADETVLNFLRSIFGNCIITDTDEQAIAEVQKKSCDCAVSRSGLLVHKSGYFFGGSEQKNKQAKLGRREKIEKTQKEIEKITIEIDELSNQINDLNTELSAIDIQALTISVRQAESKLKNYEQKISQMQLRRQAIEQSLDIVSQSNSQIEQEISEINTELASLQSQIDNAIEQLSIAKEEYAAVQSALAKVELQLNNTDKSIRELEIEQTKLNSEISSLNNDKNRLLSNIKSLENKIKQKNDELFNGDKIAEELKQNNLIYSEQLAELKTEYDKLINRNNFLISEKNSLAEQIEQYTETLNSLRTNYDKIKENIHQSEIKISEINVQFNLIKDKLRDDYQIDPEINIIDIPQDFNPDEVKIKLSELKNKLAALGNVNFLALEEYEKENERLNFYENQINDLLNAEKTLKETIAEINLTAERNFSQTFEKIHNNFKKLFKTLFGEEGEAELRIDEGRLLETDIEIIAKPPNKRPITIEQLSQGEKTLTAIALLFAIYLVKPSPFCILDEVDAPLDDANIEKFLNLIREFSNNTQFIIVTHNKKTMTAANTLYGVTMQEVGVSKTVSVSLEQVENSL